MKELNLLLIRTLAIVVMAGVVYSPSAKAAESLDTGKIEEIVGIKGTSKENEYKISIPQKDLSVVVDGFKITPPMGLTSWVGFAPCEHGAMIMGDIILQEKEIWPVEKTVIAKGLTATALHNHFIRDDKKVMFMHIYGMEPVDQMAQSVRAVLDKMKELRGGDPAEGDIAPVQNSIDTKKIESILGQKGETNLGVFKITIGRPDVSLKDDDVEVTSFMGFTWAAFQGTDEKAAVAGDFAMLSEEVAPVIKALVSNNIEVVAIHNHMVTENPRIFFLHYWGVGKAAKMAEGLKEALDETGKAHRAQ